MPVTAARRRTASVLVIGTGAAGLRAAIAAHQEGAEVVVIGKRFTTDLKQSPARRNRRDSVPAGGGECLASSVTEVGV